LLDFNDRYLNFIDKRTTLIVVGDGRNNYNDPQLEVFREITRRTRRSIWLTPESKYLWGTGDSDLIKYSHHCDLVLQAGTLTQLGNAIDQLLT
jgi:uncharacterized protein with von Willebrand factor type A (vWA) domain